MEYNSFYGGRRGASFIIAKSFRLIDENKISQYEDHITEEIKDKTKYPNGRADWIEQNVMSVAFRHGGQYKTVNYDEYVIIDTFNKNDIDNGKIYRRGYNYANDPNGLGGAEYIGQIVGPAGLGPHLQFDTMDEVQKVYDDAPESDKLNYRTDTGIYNVDNNSILPGKNGNTYNDNIEWKYVSVRDSKSLETTTYIGFKIPYTVIEYIAETSDKSYASSAEHLAQTKIVRTDDKTHPFYEQWKITIPKGIKGDTLQNFKLYTPTSNTTMKDINGTSHTLTAGKTVLVYDYIKYNNKSAGEKITLYLGEYDVIDDITMAADGTITVIYKGNKNNTIFSKAIKYITKVELTPAGQFTITYNNNRQLNGQSQTYTTTLKWVTGVAVNTDGSVTTSYNNGNPTTTGRNLQWVENIRVDNTSGTNNGKVYRKYSNTDSEDEIAQLKYVKDVNMSSNGKVTAIYNTNETKEVEQIKYVKNVDMSANGIITYSYNDNTTKQDDTQIKYINDIILDNNGTITYKNNANEIVKTQENKLRWIVNSVYNANAGTLTFNYNYGEADVYEYKYISNVDLSENGLFTVTDNTGANILSKTIEYPTKVELIDGHTLKITANTGNILLEEKLQWVKDIDIYGDKFRLHYNDNTTKTLNDVLLNQINKMAIPTSGDYAYHLLVYYSASSKRGTITYDGLRGWIDLGLIKDYNGILIGTNILKSTDPSLNTISGCLSYLNANYPNGITTGYAAGKVVTIGDSESDKGFYAYDYDNSTWIYLGSINTSEAYPSVIMGDNSVATQALDLPAGSLWFVVEGE